MGIGKLGRICRKRIAVARFGGGGCSPAERQESAAEESPPVDNWNARCGAHGVAKEGACEVGRRILLTREMYDSEMNYATETHKIDIRMASLSTVARKGYRRSWEHWISLRRGQNKSVWLGIREEFRGETLANFMLIEHDVIGLKAPAIRGDTRRTFSM